MNSVNLIPMDRQLRSARRARLVRWSVISGSSACLLALAAGMLRVSEARSASLDANQISRLNTEIADKTKAASQIRGEILIVNRQIQASRVVTEHPDYSVLLAMLSQTAGSQITLKQCAVDRPAQGDSVAKNIAPTLKLSGFGISQSAVTSFVLRLESTGMFDQVTLLRSNEQIDTAGVSTAFQLECLFDGAGRETP